MSDIEAQLPVLARPHRARVDPQRRRARADSFLGILRLQHPQPEHAPRLRARAAVAFFDWLEAHCVSRVTTYRLRKDGSRQWVSLNSGS